MGIYDRLNRPAKLNFKEKWMKRYCYQRKNWYNDTEKEFYKFYLKEAGGKLLLSLEKSIRYETYNFNF